MTYIIEKYLYKKLVLFRFYDDKKINYRLQISLASASFRNTYAYTIKMLNKYLNEKE